MVFPSQFKNLTEYLEKTVLFLQKYSWLYEAPVTHLLTRDILASIPEDWIKHLLKLSNDEINELPRGLIKDGFPQSLADFSQDCQRFTLPILASDVQLYNSYNIDDRLQTAPREIWRGMSPKKKEEVVVMSEFVHHECKLLEINKVVDLGSGLGYIDRLLLLRGYKILGIESQVKLVSFATVQKDNFFPPIIANNLIYQNMKISENMSLDIRSTILNEMLCSKTRNVKSIRRGNNENANKYDWEKLMTLYKESSDNATSDKVCIIGLHACGDLAVTGMKLFLDIPEVSALVMVPCCYHKMALENSNSNQLDSEMTEGGEICDEGFENINEERFCNFPLSDALKKVSVGAKFVCRPFLRLASQGSNNSWQDWTEAKHQRHAYNVLSRAVIQLYCDQEGVTLKKYYRRVVKKTSVSVDDFSSYIDETMDRCEFVNDNKLPISQKNEAEIKNQLLAIWDQHNHKLRLIEVLTGLQKCLEPVAESLVVADRVGFLQENGIHDVRLVQMMNNRLSPRSLAYIVSKSR